MGAEALECEVKDVAALLRARTYSAQKIDPEHPLDVVAGGSLLGEFSADTKPTAEQVEGLIKKAAIEVRARLGQDPEDEILIAFAKDVVALRAAMGAELEYRPEQTNPEDSIYDKLEDRFEKGMSALVDALPDTSATSKGFYSLRTRSEISGVFPTDVLLP